MFRCLYRDRLVSCVNVKLDPLHTRFFQGTVSLNVAGGGGVRGLADEYTVKKVSGFSVPSRDVTDPGGE